MFSPYKWAENATYAAITAVVSANIVLVAYVITSVLEDKQVSSKNPKEKSEGKKDKWIWTFITLIPKQPSNFLSPWLSKCKENMYLDLMYNL